MPWPLDGGREAEIGGRNNQKLSLFTFYPAHSAKKNKHTRENLCTYDSPFSGFWQNKSYIYDPHLTGHLQLLLWKSTAASHEPKDITQQRPKAAPVSGFVY
ncbi:hypothetical protein JOB18_028417 [Solea senegalensis]|uniref:Uncharacterized protein n=1 Tax=Solea senegalensis TaxID=28829 RepID=A0AAV6QF36_SOLSE|nr:hypothetical protein JOB18_028417 [Solea senegalensis]